MIPGVIESDVCLLPMVSSDSVDFINLYSHYKNRILFQAGGISDQPAPYMEAMQLIHSIGSKE